MKAPLPRRRGLYRERGVPRDEMLLGDIVQSFEARGLEPSISGAGTCRVSPTNTNEPARCTACALTALITYGDYAKPNLPPGISFAAAYGWDEPVYGPGTAAHGTGQPFSALDLASYNAGFAAHEAMDTLDLGRIEIVVDDAFMLKHGACSPWRKAVAGALPVRVTSDVDHLRRELTRVANHPEVIALHREDYRANCQCSFCRAVRAYDAGATVDPDSTPLGWLYVKLLNVLGLDSTDDYPPGKPDVIAAIARRVARAERERKIAQ